MRRATSPWLRLLALCACLASLACAGCGDGGDDGPGDGEPGEPGDGTDMGVEPGALEDTHAVMLTPTEHLLRASMALRGMRPAPDELEAVAADPDVLPSIVDYYLGTDEFGATIREMHAEALLIGVDPVAYPAGFPPVGVLSGMTMQELNGPLVESPLRLIEHVVMNDLPYTEIVTADYAVADSTVATVWGMDYDDGAGGWQQTHYTDERPMAGILSDSFVFTRHSTTLSNKSRGRASVIARALLCYDFLDRDIPIDSSIDLADSDAVTQAVKDNPACVSCHQTLDPLAAFFSRYSPIYVPQDITEYPFEFYTPGYASVLSVTDENYFGITGGDIHDLGLMMSQDPRFSECAVRRFYGFLTQIDAGDVPIAELSAMQDVLLDGDYDAKALVRAIVLSDGFRRSHALPEASDEQADALVGMLKTRPEALARMFEDLTGFEFRTDLPYDIGGGAAVGEIDLMNDAFFGFKVLWGGTDSGSVTRPSHTMSATSALVISSLASRAADHVVGLDFNLPRERRYLMRDIDDDQRDEADVRAQLSALHLRLYAVDAATDSPEVDASYGLFAAVLQDSDNVRRAWRVTLHAMLQDIRMVYY